ncbi:MAG: hypothetical protein ACI8UO_002526, partial [Verrucomicrobiales bacterium]
YSGSVRFDFQPSRDLHPSPTLTSGSVWTSHLTPVLPKQVVGFIKSVQKANIIKNQP